jgi:hypothetical protein
VAALKSAACLALALGSALPAWATTDCDPIFLRKHDSNTHAVIAYVDAAATGAKDNDLRQLERNFRSTVLLDYASSLGGPPAPSGKQLIFVVCGLDKQPTSITSPQDIEVLASYRVAMAVWRARERGRPVVGHAVIPQIERDRPSDPGDLDVQFDDKTSAENPIEGWEEAIKADKAALSSLLGLGLGLRYLERKEWPVAKLVLCKSRKDLQSARESLSHSTQPASRLDELLGTLLAEAEQKIATSPARPDAELQKRINTACAP